MLTLDNAPSASLLRQFGILAFLFSLLVAFRLRHGPHPALPTGILAVGVLLCLIGLARPRLLRVAYLGACTLGYPLGWVVSNLAMALLFYGVMTPLGLVLRTWRSDPLQRRFDRDASTYWEPMGPARPVQDYYRHY